MRDHNKPDPTCHYYEDQPCAKVQDCPVHGPVLDRPKKRIHYLRPEKENFRRDKGSERLWYRTFCGIYLHPRMDTVELAKTYSGGFSEFFKYRDVLELQGLKHRPIPSENYLYEIFYRVGTSRGEILVGDMATCTSCLNSKHPNTDITTPSKNVDYVP